MKNPIQNQRGQGLVEYIVLVALIGCATIGTVRLLQKTVKVNIANAIHAMQSENKKETHERLTEDDVRKSSFKDFMNGSH